MPRVDIELRIVEQRLREDHALIAVMWLLSARQAPGRRSFGLRALTERIQMPQFVRVETVRQHNVAVAVEERTCLISLRTRIEAGRCLSADTSEALTRTFRIAAPVLLLGQLHQLRPL